jgi:hypothetical protein
MSEALDEIIIESLVVGGAQRVTALDPASLVEVVFQAPLTADRATILQLARQKLEWRIARAAGRSRNTPPDDRGGTLV